jgi:hypothetical protein
MQRYVGSLFARRAFLACGFLSRSSSFKPTNHLLIRHIILLVSFTSQIKMSSKPFSVLVEIFVFNLLNKQVSSSDVVTSVPVPIMSIPATTNKLKPWSLRTMLPDLSTPREVDTYGGECEHMNYGKGGPQPFPDTALAFLQMPELSHMALDADIQPGYDLVYDNQHASSLSEKFLTFDTLDKYSTSECAFRCRKAEGCQAFNIFFERFPTFNLGLECRNTVATTAIKWALWGNKLNKTVATNTGYMRYDFQVVIAGSNAYNKVSRSPRTAGSSAQISVGLGLLLATLVAFGLR